MIVHNVGHHDVYVLLDDGGPGILGHVAGYYVDPMVKQLVEPANAVGWAPASSEQDVLRFTTPLELGWRRKRAEAQLQLRPTDIAQLEHAPPYRVLGVHLPIFGPVLREWLANTDASRGKRVLITSSDVESDDHRLRQTSTANATHLLEAFARRFIAGIEVRPVLPIRGNPFQFGSLVGFTRDRLVPEIFSLPTHETDTDREGRLRRDSSKKCCDFAGSEASPGRNGVVVGVWVDRQRPVTIAARNLGHQEGQGIAERVREVF